MSVGTVTQYPVPGLAHALNVFKNCTATLSSSPSLSYTHVSTTCTFGNNSITCNSIFTAQNTGTVSSFTYSLTCDGNNVITVQYNCPTSLTINSGTSITVTFIERYSKQF